MINYCYWDSANWRFYHTLKSQGISFKARVFWPFHAKPGRNICSLAFLKNISSYIANTYSSPWLRGCPWGHFWVCGKHEGERASQQNSIKNSYFLKSSDSSSTWPKEFWCLNLSSWMHHWNEPEAEGGRVLLPHSRFPVSTYLSCDHLSSVFHCAAKRSKPRMKFSTFFCG